MFLRLQQEIALTEFQQQGPTEQPVYGMPGPYDGPMNQVFADDSFAYDNFGVSLFPLLTRKVPLSTALFTGPPNHQNRRLI